MAIQQKPTTQQDYLDTIAAFVANTTYDDLPEDVRLHAKYVWMDTLGVIIGGSREPQAAALAQRLGGPGGTATILGPGFPRCDSQNAALVNGTTGTFLELDERHPPRGHPSIYTIPAILALAEATDATGSQLIEAQVLAYEFASRLSWAARLIHGIHVHGSLGVVGASVAAARILGFDASQTREAISLGSSFNAVTPGLAAIEGALVRNVYAGYSGHMGVVIADLVQSGFTGLHDGLRETYTNLIGSAFEPSHFTEGLGDDYSITTNIFKMHAACGHLHPTLDALESALAGRTLPPEEVEGVRVVGTNFVVEYGRTDPQNSLAAKFSVPFAVATRIAKNSTWVSSFDQAAVDDPATRDLARRVTVEEDQAFTQRWPHEHPARVEVVTTSGETLRGEVDRPRGGPHTPFSYEDLKAKFSSLTSPFFNGKEAQAIELFMHMDELPRAGDLTAGLRELAG